MDFLFDLSFCFIFIPIYHNCVTAPCCIFSHFTLRKTRKLILVSQTQIYFLNFKIIQCLSCEIHPGFPFLGIIPASKVIETCVSTGEATEAEYARVSKISVDSFDTSSTSSGECYENTNGYVLVMTGQFLKPPPC